MESLQILPNRKKEKAKRGGKEEIPEKVFV